MDRMSQDAATFPCLRALIRWLAPLLLIVAAHGCRRDERQWTDADQIWGLVANMSEVAADAKGFQSFFVDGTAPDESQRLRYKRGGYAIASGPKVSGSSATMTVTVSNAATGEELGKMEWTAEKVGDAWKLKEAPLPEGA
jgi:hypothetical protein